VEVDADLRFGSHRDLLRAMERLGARARLPLHYSQGFNPRPHLSLLPPRPVGVATRDDRLVVSLDAEAEAWRAARLRRRLQASAPEGLRFGRPSPLPPKTIPRAQRMTYAMRLREGQREAVGRRWAHLQNRPHWPIRRPGRRGHPARSLDLRCLVAALVVDGAVLRWTAVPDGDRWARPQEVLALLHLDARADLARVVRTAVDYVS